MVRCALCHDDLAPGSERRCEACGTLLHAECAAGLAGCPTLGCARRLQPTAPAKRGFWDPWRASCAVIALLSLLVCGGGYVWLERDLRESEARWRAEHQAWLERQLGGDVASFAKEARALHTRLRPGAERPLTADELADYPRLRASARGGVVARPDGVVVYFGEPFMSGALVVQADARSRLPAPLRRVLEEPNKHPDLLVGLEEVEPGVFLRTVSR